MSTLEGWASPTTATKYADHTFVYCPSNKKIFGCWAGGNINDPDTVKICSGAYKNAYAVANCYRDSLPKLPDTAGLGVYGVNGVCHQSANLFLYAAGTNLKLVNGRPNGLIASTAAYGMYGSMGPFDVPGRAVHWGAWYPPNYWWCSGKKDNLRAEVDDRGFLETQQLLELAREKPGDAKVTDLAILIQDSVPGLDLEAIADLQSRYLEEHEGYLRADTPVIPEVKVIDANSAQRLNTLSAQFQKDLAQLIGPIIYTQLTGRGPDETIELIDPRIIESAQRAASQR
jgi:hypothetical protein